MKRAKMRRVVTAATPPEAPPAEPATDDAPALTAWTDADTAVLCFVTDAAIAQTGFDPAADPPMFVPIGAVADLDQPSVKAAIIATLALDDEEDEAEAPDTDTGAPEVFVLVWGDPTKPENLTAFPEDADEATEPEPAEASPQAMPGMGLATDALLEGPAPEPMPDEEERTIPVPGPLGMFEACLVTEGVATDEVFETDESGSVVMGRLIPPGVLTWRTPPLSGGFAVNDVGSPADNGHMGAPVACAATEIVREGNRIMARGPYLDNADGMALKAAVDGGAPIAPSIDLGASDQWEITTEADGTSRRTLVAGSIAGFVVLPYEAQHSTEDGEWLTWFRSAPDTALTPPEAMPEEMPALVPVAASACPVTWESLVACGSGSSGPIHPPAEWFQPPVMDGPTALHVTAEGQVWGHLAGPGCHIGMPDQCVTVAGATSKDFTQFHHGADDGQGIVLADGSRLRVGALTLAGGHADLRASAREAKAHYDESDSVVAFLRAGWDEKNNLPWIAGSLLPNVPENKLQIVRALGQSGDWREPDGSDWRAQEVWRTIDGKPTLIAATVVPVEGFPKLSRALAAGGFIEVEIVDTALALTAAGEMAVIGAADLPIAPRDTSWDAAGASKRLAALCTEGDTLDPGCFGRGFFYRDDSQPDSNVGSYKLGFADVVNGKLQAIPKGVIAVAGALQGARGGVDIPAADQAKVKGRVAAYYDRINAAQPDQPKLVPPWEDSKSAVAADGLLLDLARDMYVRRLGEVASVLASAHEREAERLGASLH